LRFFAHQRVIVQPDECLPINEHRLVNLNPLVSSVLFSIPIFSSIDIFSPIDANQEQISICANFRYSRASTFFMLSSHRCFFPLSSPSSSCFSEWLSSLLRSLASLGNLSQFLLRFLPISSKVYHIFSGSSSYQKEFASASLTNSNKPDPTFTPLI
jgi:hypothetical protein